MCSEGRRKSREASPAVQNRVHDEEIPLGSIKGNSARKSISSSSQASDLNGPSSNSSTSTQSSQASKLTLNISSEDAHKTTSSVTNGKEISTNKDDVTTPHHETSFISDVSEPSTSNSNNVLEETNQVAKSVDVTPQHSSHNNGPSNSVFVPKVKKKGAIETV